MREWMGRLGYGTWNVYKTGMVSHDATMQTQVARKMGDAEKEAALQSAQAELESLKASASGDATKAAEVQGKVGWTLVLIRSTEMSTRI